MDVRRQNTKPVETHRMMSVDEAAQQRKEVQVADVKFVIVP